MIRRLTLVVSTLGAGGAERVMSTMANYWVERGTAVTLITFTPSSEDHYRLDPRINRVVVDIFWNSGSVLGRLRDQITRIIRIRKAIRQSHPDVVISFVDRTNIRILFSLIGTRIPVVVSERSNPLRWQIGWVWNRARKILYRHADAIVVQTESVRQWLAAFVEPERIVVIPNAVREPADGHKLLRSESGRTVVAMGRLSEEKGFDLLLQAWAQLGPEKADWRLLIIGSGPLDQELQSLAKTLGVHESVGFAGLVENPEQTLREASIFVLSSRFEGFPNALLEAMSLGLAVVSFDCDNGPREIIRHEIDGLLLPAGDPIALAAGIRQLMSNASERARLSVMAMEVTQRFSQDSIMARWQTVIDSVIDARATDRHG